MGVARSADFNDSIDVFKKFSLVILASLAPGFMYLGGMQALIETTENYFKGLEKHPVSYLNKIRDSLSKAGGINYFKGLAIGLFSVFSTILDATNAKTGVEALAGQTAGIIAGVGNGIAESILPLFTLGKLFDSIANDFKCLYLGTRYKEEELNGAITAIKDFVNHGKKETDDLLYPQDERMILAVLQEMNWKEQLAIAKIMGKVRDSRQFALHLSRQINGEDLHLSNFRIRILAASRIIANFLMSYCSAWIFSRGLSTTQIVSHYETELSRYNLTLDNIANYLAQNQTSLDIEPFNPSVNALNQLSYALQGIAFLPLIGQTFFEVMNLFRCVFNPCDRTNSSITHIKKALFASSIAGIGTTCYVVLGLDAKKGYESLQQLLEIEEFEVPQISFFPDFSLLPYFALLILISIIYGGASNAAKKVYDALPSPTSSRSSEKSTEQKCCTWKFFS